MLWDTVVGWKGLGCGASVFTEEGGIPGGEKGGMEEVMAALSSCRAAVWGMEGLLEWEVVRVDPSVGEGMRGVGEGMRVEGSFGVQAAGRSPAWACPRK